MIAGGVAASLLATALGESLPAPADVGAPALAAIAYLVVFGTIVGFVAYSFLLRNVPAPRAATYAYVNPVVAVALGAMIGETLAPTTAVAMLVVLGSVALTLAPVRPRAAPRRLAPVPCRASL